MEERGSATAHFGLIGDSPAMKRVYRLIERVLDADVPVLLDGQTGTGKEVVARAIHEHGRRRAGPLVIIDCGALPVSLAEAEFFGHKKGAFTDAHRDKIGLLERASGGTLFIDEIGDITVDLQAKLLRFLQEGEIRRIGDTHPIKVDVRVIAATNRDLRERIAAGTFRKDLFFRLAVVTIPLPPLAERREDIAMLAQHFLRRIAAVSGRPPHELTKSALAVLEEHTWPGNVRELQNVLQRATVLGGAQLITAADLPASVRESLLPSGATLRGAEQAAAAAVARRMITGALAASGGDVRAAARALGTPVKTIYYKLSKLGIDPANFREIGRARQEPPIAEGVSPTSAPIKEDGGA